MRKSCKKIVSVLIAMIILFTVAPITTSALTQNDVVSWMDSKNGTTIYDGGSQCVAAFNSYLRIWGISNPISKYPVNYAYQIFNYNAPDDWQKISGSGNYQVGDVVIWNSSVGGGAGHVGMVYSTSGGTVKIFDQNYVTKNVCDIHNIAQTSAIIGVFRPPLGNNLPDPVDLGTDFYAYIMNTNSWKPLVNDSSHNACFNYDVYENQKIWHFIKKSNGSYKIISLFDNNALDVDLGKSDSGTDVGVWTDSDTANQEWFIYGSS
uniref:CHAP domain-containing protein n=1 Tax=Ruminococcus bromii TaxID=40518 RepID=UPI00402A0F69